ncbi:MAG: hypothetical protein AAGG99_05105 [Pseudomonadota bacterium]
MFPARHRATVEILHAESDRVFVRGTFAQGAEVLINGPHRVVTGQQVVRAAQQS